MFLQVFTSSYINLFRWILYFIVHIQDLGNNGYNIALIAKSGGSFAPSLLTFSFESFYKFLHQFVQVDSIFYLWLSTFEPLVLFKSSCKFMHQLVCSLVAFSIGVVWESCINSLSLMLLHESFYKLVLTIDPKAIVGLSNSIIMKCKCFWPLC